MAAFFLPVLAMLAAFGPLSIDMYLPSLPAIGREFGASAGDVQLTLSAFFVGFGIGQLLYGPLSDRYGRRPMLLFGVSVYLVASAGAAFAPDIGALTAARFFQALGGGAATVIARASVRDRHSGAEAARMLSTLMLIMGTAPLLAPSLGAQVLQFADWRAIFLLLAGWGGLALLAVVFLLPETRPPEMRSRAGLGSIFLNYGRLVSERQTLGCALASGGAFAGMFAYISGTPFVFMEVFGVSPETYGLLFAVHIVAIMAGAFTNRRLVGRFGPAGMMARGTVLLLAAGLALILAVLLLPGSLAAIVAALLCFMFALNLIAANTIVIATADKPELAGTVIALIGAGHFALGTISGLAVGQFHDGTALPLALTVAACGLVSFSAHRWLVRAPDAD